LHISLSSGVSDVLRPVVEGSEDWSPAPSSLVPESLEVAFIVP
jgi:hypothetical protein